MLTIKTVKNPLVTGDSKDGFCFRSSCSQSLSQKKLAGEMADWNSSLRTPPREFSLKTKAGLPV